MSSERKSKVIALAAINKNSSIRKITAPKSVRPSHVSGLEAAAQKNTSPSTSKDSKKPIAVVIENLKSVILENSLSELNNSFSINSSESSSSDEEENFQSPENSFVIMAVSYQKISACLADFDGKRSSLPKFLHQIDLCGKMLAEGQDEAALIPFIRSKLDPLTFNGLSLMEFPNLIEFKNAVQGRFSWSANPENIRIMISGTRQEEDEELLSFVEKLDSLASEFTSVYTRKYPTADAAQIQLDLDNLLLKTFVENIKPSLRIIAKTKDFNTYAAAKSYMREKAFEDSKADSSGVKKLMQNFAKVEIQKDLSKTNPQFYRQNFNTNPMYQNRYRQNDQYFQQHNNFPNRNFDNRQVRAFSEPAYDRGRGFQGRRNDNVQNDELYYRYPNSNRNYNLNRNTNFPENRNVFYGEQARSGYVQNNADSRSVRYQQPSTPQQYQQQSRFDRPQFEQKGRGDLPNKQ